MIYLESDFAEPPVNLGCLRVHALGVLLLGDDADAVAEVTVGRGLHDVLQSLRRATVGGAEGDNGFALQVVLLQEREDGHRSGVPPYGHADENYIILCHIIHFPLDGRTRPDLQDD